MKHLILLAGIAALTCAMTPAARADQAAPALAKSTAEQHALAEAISARVRSALDGEPYDLDKSCNGAPCTVSQSRR
jgi:hypothetical protein